MIEEFVFNGNIRAKATEFPETVAKEISFAEFQNHGWLFVIHDELRVYDYSQ